MPNMITTGEKIEGITSCIDRLCILYDTNSFNLDMRDERIKILENIPNNLFFLAAYRFCKKLVSNYNQVIREIGTMREYMLSETSASRVAFHNNFIYETAIFYEKYMCGGDRRISKLDELQRCFENNMAKQQNEIERLRLLDRQETVDWIMVVYKSACILDEKEQCVELKYFDPSKHFAFIKNNVIYIKDNLFSRFLQISVDCIPNESKAVNKLETYNLLLKEDGRHKKKRYNDQWYYAIRMEPLKMYCYKFGI